MPLIDTVHRDSGYKKRNLQMDFGKLPDSDKRNVIRLIEMGQSEDDEIEFGDEGREFVAKPEFKEYYEKKMQPKDPLMPVIAGLMQMIQQFKVNNTPEVPDGHLKKEHANRIGGHEKCKTCGK